MPNSIITAAVTSLPSQPSRRAMLAKIPAGAVGVALLPPALSIAISDRAQSAPLVAAKGNPELIALYTELKQAEQDFVAADSAVKAARPMYDQVVRAVPDELLRDRNDKLWFLADEARDIEGKCVWVEPGIRKCIITSYALKIGAEDYGPRSKIGRLIRERIDVALDYEQRIDDVAERTGIRKAVEARNNAETRINDLVKRIAEADARSKHDLFIKASSILTCGAVAHSSKMLALVFIGPKLVQEMTEKLSVIAA